ncbi:MAG: hypothetical protein AAF438_14150, partial [Pseudomonadota bacterium]
MGASKKPTGYADLMVGVAASGVCRNTPKRLLASTIFVLWFLVIAGVSSISFAQTTPPGTVIANTATIDYVDNGGGANSVASNQIDIVALPPQSTSTVEFLRVTPTGGDSSEVGPTQCAAAGGGFAPLPNPVLFDGTVIDPIQAQPVVNVDIYHTGEPFFVRLDDADQNLDATLVDTVDVRLSVPSTGDSEILRLSETGVNTGVFAGHIPSQPLPVVVSDCALQVSEENQILVDYQDPRNPNDTASAEVVVDPFGVVFNSQTGEFIDGAQISIVDAGSGIAAAVFGDDGASTFPDTIASGGQATDSASVLYVFSQGGFRFPVVPAGDYILVVTPPDGFVAPSTADVVDLQLLPGAPYALSPGSFGLPFSVSAGQVINIDIPLDPQQAGLFVQKVTNTTIASPGDFVAYAVTVDNPDGTDADEVILTDTLPLGFRFVSGSLRINGNVVADPTTDTDGRTLSIGLDTVAANSSVRVEYVTEVTVGARQDEATNVASAQPVNGQPSNVASATIRLTEDLFRSNSFLMGRVITGECQEDTAKDLNGVQGVRVYLEDGRYAITDEDGRYHFEGLEPGTHVVQIDMETLPEYLEPQSCEQNSRFAGRNFSRFVELNPGSLWRADFFTKE